MQIIKMINKITLPRLLLIICVVSLVIMPIPKISFNNGFCEKPFSFFNDSRVESQLNFHCVSKWGFLSDWLYINKLKLNFNEQDFSSIITMGIRADNEQLIEDAFNIAVIKEKNQALLIHYLLFFMSNHRSSSEHFAYLLGDIDYTNSDNQRAFIAGYCLNYQYDNLSEIEREMDLVLGMKKNFLDSGLKPQSLICSESEAWRGQPDGRIPELGFK